MLGGLVKLGTDMYQGGCRQGGPQRFKAGLCLEVCEMGDWEEVEIRGSEPNHEPLEWDWPPCTKTLGWIAWVWLGLERRPIIPSALLSWGCS